MSQVQCINIADESSWTRWENNKLYRMSLECVKKDSQLKKQINSYKIIQNNNGKYVVYDNRGKLVIMSAAKNICKEFVKDKCRVRQRINR